MSVLVKGMEMPESCIDCEIKQYDDYEDDCVCPFSGVVCLSIGRQDACPLVALPDKHGRLVDADMVDEQPTIEPRKKGKWIPQNLNKSDGMISTAVYYYPKCSVCGANANYTNFCPNCGAEMEYPEDIPMEYFESGGR